MESKREVYDELVSRGARLRAFSRVSLEELVTMKAMMDTAEKARYPREKPPMLTFTESGWCDELGCSYYIGQYAPRSWREYEALKGYAKKEMK